MVQDFLMSKKLTIIFVTLTLLLLFSQKQAGGASVVKTPLKKEVVIAKQLDKEAQILADYLERRNSPLQYHAQDFVDAAREYDLDWKMLPAIAGVESTFGKFIPGGYNAWGWGVYGTNAIYFTSWREAIFTISEGLREGYLNKGLNDPYSINRVYAASPVWGRRVSYFMKDLDRFEKQYVKGQALSEGLATKNAKIAAVSGLLALNTR